MPYNTNDPNYQTKNTRISNFNDFSSNIRREKSDLEKLDRDIINDDDEIHKLPGNKKWAYNRVSNKWDDDSKEEIEDSIDAIDDDGYTDPKHKYKVDAISQQKNENVNHLQDLFYSNLKKIEVMSEHMSKYVGINDVEKLIKRDESIVDNIIKSRENLEKVYNFFKK